MRIKLIGRDHWRSISLTVRSQNAQQAMLSKSLRCLPATCNSTGNARWTSGRWRNSDEELVIEHYIDLLVTFLYRVVICRLIYTITESSYRGSNVSSRQAKNFHVFMWNTQEMRSSIVYAIGIIRLKTRNRLSAVMNNHDGEWMAQIQRLIPSLQWQRYLTACQIT